MPQGPSEADTFIQQQERFRARSNELLAKARRVAEAIRERVTDAMTEEGATTES
jgi:hypothetical protein